MDYVGPSIKSQGLYVGINGAVSAGSDGIQTTAWWEAVGQGRRRVERRVLRNGR